MATSAKNASADYLLNLVAEGEPQPARKEALIAVARQHLQILLAPDAQPAAEAPPTDKGGKGSKK